MLRNWIKERVPAPLVYACAFGVAIRLLHIFCGPIYAPHDEATLFDAIGLNLASGNHFALPGSPPMVTRAPLFPFFLSLIYRTCGHHFIAVYLIHTALFICTALVLFQLAQEVFLDRTVSLATVWLFACFPGFIGYTNGLKKEILLCFLLIQMTYLLVRAVKSGSLWAYCFAGIWLGLSDLIRPIGLLFPLWFSLLAFFYPPARRRAVFAGAAVFCISSWLVIMPWTLRNRLLVPDQWIPVSTDAGVMLFGGNYPPAQGSWIDCAQEPVKGILERAGYKPEDCLEPGPDRVLIREGLKLIAAHPATSLRLYFKKIGMLWLSGYSSSLGFYAPIQSRGELIARYGYSMLAFVALCKFWSLLILAFFGFGLYKALRSGSNAHVPMILLLAYLTLLHAVMLGIEEYTLPVWPLVMAYAAYGAARIRDKSPI